MAAMALPLPEDRAHPIYTAHHEAGHATAYLHYGVRFKSVTIRAGTPEHLGTVEVVPEFRPGWVLGPITAAGPAAEVYLSVLHQLADPDEVDDESTEEALADGRFVAVALILGRSLDVGHAELRRAVGLWEDSVNLAVELVQDHWEGVVALATALLDSPTDLTYEDCLSVTDWPHAGGD